MNGFSGPGWYASRQEWGRIRTWVVGRDPDHEPEEQREALERWQRFASEMK